MLAPVALFAYKRPDHLETTIRSLSRNLLATETDLYIFSDGSKNINEISEIEAVRLILRSVTGFKTITVVERSENMGLARSIISGVSTVLQQHPTVIVLEDDLVTSQNFLTYMNNALLQYKDDPAAFSVTGYVYPSQYFGVPQDYAFDTFAGYRCCSNSWATWSDRWQRIDWQVGDYAAFCEDGAARERFNRGGRDMFDMLEMQQRREIDSWAIRFCYAHHANDMRCMYPTQSLVMNIGLDSSGTHSVPNPRFQHLSLDETWLPKRFAPASIVDPKIARDFRKVFDPAPPSGLAGHFPRLSLIAQTLKQVLCASISVGKRLVRRPVREVDILFLSAYQSYGGAARAAYRTFLGIRSGHPNAQLLTLFRSDADSTVFGLSPSSVRGAMAFHLVKLDQLPLQQYRARKKTPFSPGRFANPLRISLSRFKPQLLHVHWINHSMMRVEELARMRCPIVWTLHDAWAFTGGCHLPGNCTGFQNQCGSCPQLGSTHASDLSHIGFQHKRASFENLNLTVVTPSGWLAKLAAASQLLKGRRIEVIPNGIDLDAFKPINRSAAREYFGISLQHPVVLFGTNWLADPNKGQDLLLKALAGIGTRCTLVTFGAGAPPGDPPSNLTIHALGQLTDDASLALVYSAADVFVCPSRQENLPNTVAEALACGTPCVAFAVGGLPEMIDHQQNGWLATPFDTDELVSGIKWLMNHPDPIQLRLASRAKAEACYDASTTTRKYLALYTEVLGQRAA